MGNGDIRKGHTSREDRWVLGNNSKITKLKVQNDQARRDQRKSVLIKPELGLLWEEPFWNISAGRTFHCLRHTQLSHQEHRESFLGKNGLQCLPRLDL